MKLLHRLAALCLVAVLTCPAQGASIWFTPRSPIPVWNSPAPDFQALFEPDAPWQAAASHVAVFKLYSQFLGTDLWRGGSTDEQLRQVIDDLRRRHIALGVEIGLMTGAGMCGKVEGYCGEEAERRIARLQRLGGELRFVAMDEPLWYGHIATAAGAVSRPIEEVARDVASQVATIHRYFPEAQVGDIDPIGSDVARPGYPAEVAQWLEAYRQATGVPLAFFHADVAWRTPGWQRQLQEVSRLLKERGVPLGIIYNGNPDDATGVEWTRNAERRFVEIEADERRIPDEAVIQTWHPQPDHTLPESTPGTLSYLVDRYETAETAIDARRSPEGLEGTLESRIGAVQGAPITVVDIDDGSLDVEDLQSISGVVPAGAASALVGLRANVECFCDGNVDVLLGEALYRDAASGTSNRVDVTTPGVRLVVAAGSRRLLNSKPFAVVAGDPYGFSVPMQVPYASRNLGYVALIFLDASGKEMKRVSLPFTPGRRIAWRGRTGPEGRFAARFDPAEPHSSVQAIEFDGDSRHRLVERVLTRAPAD